MDQSDQILFEGNMNQDEAVVYTRGELDDIAIGVAARNYAKLEGAWRLSVPRHNTDGITKLIVKVSMEKAPSCEKIVDLPVFLPLK
jgi:hypothetical protein